MIDYPKNILIVRTDRIGDLVLTLPMAGIIKNKYPDSKVTFLVREYTRPIVEKNQFVDNVVTIKEENGKISLFRSLLELRKNNYDLSIVVFPAFKIALLMVLAGIKIRIGTGYRWYSFLFNKKVYQHRKNAEHHELEFNVNLLSEIGINEKVDPGNIDFGFSISKTSEQKIGQLLFSKGIKGEKPIVIVHPGSGGSAVDLPIIKYKNLVTLMAQELNVDIVITGSGAEKEICEELIVNSSVKSFAGQLNLDELIALISKSEMLIGNSSGPIHLGAALNKFVIGFYPKVVTCSPERWGPYTNKKVVFTPKLDCSNCNKEQCKKLNCMDSIEIKDVFENIKNILHFSVAEK